MNYVSIKSIIPFINEDIIDIDSAIEYAYQAYDLIGVKSQYSQESCIVTVDNFKAKLPSDLYRIECVVYVPEFTKSVSSEDRDTAPQTDTNYTYNSEHISRIQQQGIINNYNLYTLPLINKEYNMTSVILRYVNGPFSKNYVCSGCPNITSNCEYTFTITHNNEIVTNVEEGLLCVAYLSYAKDENGDLLIPDDADLKQAISTYIHMRAFELRMHNAQTKAYFELYKDYRQTWELLSTKVRGNLKIKDLDSVVISQIQERYLSALNMFLRRIR